MITIGIDGGLNGGIVIINDELDILKVAEMPIITGQKREYDLLEIVKIFNQAIVYARGDVKNIRVYLEKAIVIPISGKKHLFTNGICYGMMQGILASMKLSYEIIAPKRWMKIVFEGLSASDTKQASALFCTKKWPQYNWKRGIRVLKFHDGLTDGACIAYYGYLLNKTLVNQKEHK